VCTCRSKGSENLQMQFCMAISVDYTVYNFQVVPFLFAIFSRATYVQLVFFTFRLASLRMFSKRMVVQYSHAATHPLRAGR
jgi:hypothetical protein